MKRKDVKYYRVPDEYWYRLHFVRPRFKNNIENVLLHFANECCRIPKCSCEDYKGKLFDAIKIFPGNVDATEKTLNNWRTEISALFGFYKEDKSSGLTETTKMAYFLRDNQDLTQFLRLFLYSFQFPGGHIKPQDIQDIIGYGIKFKPARSIIQVLLAGNEILSEAGSQKEMKISAEEATYCIFNDIRVTSNQSSPSDIAKTILSNRKNHIKYYNPNDSRTLSLKGTPRNRGDMTRYAADILDYMEIANLLCKSNGYYSLKGNELAAIKIFEQDETWFDGYDSFYGSAEIKIPRLSDIEPLWFDYVNKSMNPDLFKTDIRSIVGTIPEIDRAFDDRIKFVASSEDRSMKDIGDLGEAIICGHEKMRLKINGYDDYVKLVKIVDSPAYRPGYDIDSYEADGTELHRYIDVKTTVSKRKIDIYGFHMTTNEWSVAETIQEHYCIYRLMLSETDKTLFVLRNPVTLYKTDKIMASPQDGMQVSFSDENFPQTELLSWKE